MRRIAALSVTIMLLVLTTPWTGHTQGYWPVGSTHMLWPVIPLDSNVEPAPVGIPAISACGDEFAVAGWRDGRLVPKLRAGYGRMGLNVSFPMDMDPAMGVFPLKLDTVANMAVGIVSVDARPFSWATVFVDAESSALLTDFMVVTSDEPAYQGTTTLEWEQSKFGRWRVMSGALVNAWKCVPLWCHVSLMGGVGYDSLGMRMQNPRDEAGLPPGNTFSYTGDIQTSLWMPFAGFRVNAGPLRGSFTASPYVSGQARFNLRSLAQPAPAAPLFYTNFIYTLNKPGYLLEGMLEWESRPYSPRWLLNLWSRINYLEIRGTGTEKFETQAAGFSLNSKSRESSSLNGFMLAGGVALGVSF